MMTNYPETPVFVPNGDSQKETAVLLVGTGKEHGLSGRHIRSSIGGFWISEALADLVYGEAEAEAEVEVEVEAAPEPEPEAAPEPEPEPEPAKRSTKKKTSGNRAEKNVSTDNSDKE